jgi:hypothetical protein
LPLTREHEQAAEIRSPERIDFSAAFSGTAQKPNESNGFGAENPRPCKIRIESWNVTKIATKRQLFKNSGYGYNFDCDLDVIAN